MPIEDRDWYRIPEGESSEAAKHTGRWLTRLTAYGAAAATLALLGISPAVAVGVIIGAALAIGSEHRWAAAYWR